MLGNVSLNPMRTSSPSQNAMPRNVTPSKLPSMLNPSSGNRTGTPTRASSNPRSDSASKRAAKIVSIENEMNPATTRSTSRRKQRRWENMNMFGMELYHILATEELMQQEQLSHDFIFQKDTKSAFQELFLPKNQHILEAFRTCEYVPTSVIKNHTPKHFTIGDIAWLKIENRIRPILLQSLSKDPKLSLLLFCLEQVIFAFVTKQSIEIINLLIQMKAMSYFDQICEIDEERNQLKIHLIDSPHYRLLLHGISQFYDLHSKSYMLTDRNNKVTIITPSKRSSSALIHHVSFVSHLLTKVKTCSSSAAGAKEGMSNTDEQLQYRVEIGALTEQMHSMQLHHPSTTAINKNVEVEDTVVAVSTTMSSNEQLSAQED